MQYQQLYGQSTNPFSQRPGRPRILDHTDIDFLDRLLQRQPSIYLDEIQERFRDDRGIEISIATLHREIARLDITRKSISKEAKERNDLLRAVWEANMAQYDDPDLFVFLDESGVNDKTTQRVAGWSHLGVPCVQRAAFMRGTNLSVLPALSIDGIFALDIFEGAVNRDKFIEFLEEQVVRRSSQHFTLC